MIAAAFHPKDVIVRMSDFKSNEYANLVGGRRYEPVEENPMIGFRGASRYYDPRYQAGFALECRAMKKVRDEMGLTNVKLMIPFCRTVEEGHAVVAEMAKHGLERWVLDRVERPHAAHPRRRPRLGDRRAHLRRAERRGEGSHRLGDRSVQGRRP
jgi:phosphoenolpyruvate synthase/pyruvate phosphate dikinase